MTPCEKLGYKAGDEFEATEDSLTFSKGSVVKYTGRSGPLGSPQMQLVSGFCHHNNGTGMAPGAYETFDHFKPLRITLRPGDYVSTEGMTEDEYHTVARAFMAAGADRGEYPDGDDYTTELAFGIDSRNNKLFHGRPGSDGDVSSLRGRQLTINQVLNATNAGNAQPEEAKMHLTDQLEQAIKARDEAQAEVERLQAEWDAAYPNISGATKEDLSDPDNWRAGDVFECTTDKRYNFTLGKHYVMEGRDPDGDPTFTNDLGEPNMFIRTQSVKFIRRP